MKFKIPIPLILKTLLLTSMMLSISGCNTTGVFAKKEDTGSQAEQVVPQKLKELAKHETEVKVKLAQADAAFSIADFQSADEYFRAVLTLAPDNLRAKEGLRRVAIYKQHELEIEQARALIGRNDDKAADILRGVLVEDPENVEAAALYQSMMERLDAKRIEAMRQKLKYSNPVSLEFRDTELKVIVEALAKGTGVNFILDKDVQNRLRASLFVRDVSLENAINLLVQSNQLRKKVLSEDTVLIYPDTALKVRQYQDLVIRSFFLEYADPVTVANLLKTMLGIKQVQTDERLPMIMIKDVPEVMILAEKLIKSQDIAEPEVMLEMDIIELRRSVVTDLGATWPTQFSVLSDSALTLQALKDVSSETIGVSPNPTLIFDGQDTNANLLANPRIRVKNKDKAKIHIGDRIPVITSNVSSNGVISDNVQYIDAGLKLEVEPEISMGGDVTIKVNLDVSSVTGEVITNTGANVPQLGTRSTSTQLRLKDGETQILAGLISDEDRETIQKIPGLGDLPILGRLFSNHNDDNLKTELILSITPHIIRPRRSPIASSTQYWVGSELQQGRAQVGKQKLSRDELSKMFKTGTPPSTVAPQPETPPQQTPPEGLNIQLPPGLTSQF